MTDTTVANLEPRPFRLLLDDAVRWTRRYFMRLFPWVALPLTCGMVAFSVFQVRWMSSIFEMAAEPNLVRLFTGYALFLLSALGLGVLAVLTALATMVATVDAVAGRSVSLARSWRFLLDVKVLGTSLLVGVISLAGFAFMVLPGVYAWLALSFSMPVMVEEHSRLGQALGRSFHLTHQTPLGWLRSPLVKLLVILVVAYLIQSLFSLFLQLPFTMTQQVMMIRDSLEGAEGPAAMQNMMRWGWLQVPAAFFNGLTSSAVMIYTSFATTLLYFDTRRRQEGWDLEAVIDELEALSPMAPQNTGSADA